MGQLGIDIGSLYLGAVSIEEGAITHAEYRPHGGDISGTVSAVLKDPRFAELIPSALRAKFPAKKGWLSTTPSAS